MWMRYRASARPGLLAVGLQLILPQLYGNLMIVCFLRCSKVSKYSFYIFLLGSKLYLAKKESWSLWPWHCQMHKNKALLWRYHDLITPLNSPSAGYNYTPLFTSAIYLFVSWYSGGATKISIRNRRCCWVLTSLRFDFPYYRGRFALRRKCSVLCAVT